MSKNWECTLVVLVAASWVAGAVGLAWKIDAIRMPPAYVVALVDDVIRDAVKFRFENNIPQDYINTMVAENLTKQAHIWATWYYSPLNIHYWSLALLYFSPALGLTVLLRILRYAVEEWLESKQSGNSETR